MSEDAGKNTPTTGRAAEPEDVHIGQVVFDNIFLWVFLGVALPLLTYTVWGLLDIGSTPTEALAPPKTAVGTAAGAPPGTEVVQVTVGDFWIESSQTTFQPGTPYRFVVTNEGRAVHEFMVVSPMLTAAMSMEEMDEMALGVIDYRELPPGATTVLDLTFDQAYPAGSLELSCHVPGHYESGMRLPIVVG